MFKPEDILRLIHELIDRHSVEIGGRTKIMPVKWKGVDMSVEEAKMIIKELENQKLVLQERMNRVQAGGEIAKLTTAGGGIAAMITGVTLMLFPPTAIAGVITLVAGAGTAGIGKMAGDGAAQIGVNANTQAIEQIDSYIDSLRTAIIDSL